MSSWEQKKSAFMAARKPIQIGLTGGIGSGKSWVARLFTFWGIPVYESDGAAKALYREEGIKKEVLALLGNGAYQNDGNPDTRYISEKVYPDPLLRERLNGILHPAVGRAYQDWVSRQKTPFVLKVAALLFEANVARDLDSVILVSSPLLLRMERILQRDPFRSQAEIERIMASQWSEEKKIPLADFHLQNDETHSLIRQVESVYSSLQKRYFAG
jgi:dephospho-CoA kinase